MTKTISKSYRKPYQNHNCKTRPETNQNNKSYLNHIKNIKEHILKNLHPRDFGCYNGIDFGTAMTRPQTLRIQYECVKCVYKINRCIVWYNRTTISYIYIYGKCLGFARTRNDDGRRIIIIINIMFINIIIIINIIKPLLTIFNECRSSKGGGRIKPLLEIFNECRSLTGVRELNPHRRSSMNVEV